MIDAVSGIIIAIPSMIIVLALGLKGLFWDDYNPYDKLKNIDRFDLLWDNNGMGIKKILAAIKYERLKNIFLRIIDGRNLIVAFLVYFMGILTVFVLGTKDFNLGIIRIVMTGLPAIASVFLAIVTIRIAYLKKRLGD